MGQPQFYPGCSTPVELRQTHISYVFLVGEFVYKVKKLVRFTFLNYSTLEQRRCAGGGFLVQSPLRPYLRHLLLVLT